MTTSSSSVVESSEAPLEVSFAQLLVYELRVRDAMTRTPVRARPTDSLRAIQLLMKAHRFSGVPITVDGALLGIVSIEDSLSDENPTT